MGIIYGTETIFALYSRQQTQLGPQQCLWHRPEQSRPRARTRRCYEQIPQRIHRERAENRPKFKNLSRQSQSAMVDLDESTDGLYEMAAELAKEFEKVIGKIKQRDRRPAAGPVMQQQQQHLEKKQPIQEQQEMQQQQQQLQQLQQPKVRQATRQHQKPQRPAEPQPVVATNASNQAGCGLQQQRVRIEPSELRLVLKLESCLAENGSLLVRPSVREDRGGASEATAGQPCSGGGDASELEEEEDKELCLQVVCGGPQAKQRQGGAQVARQTGRQQPSAIHSGARRLAGSGGAKRHQLNNHHDDDSADSGSSYEEDSVAAPATRKTRRVLRRRRRRARMAACR
ncbi:hypothetical protein BOX15_Mlig002988g2 [Macrostomum lignano]|uniref:Uncharacterized protein n=1 Tax=Macrostomum lignano TaxID=282301 RepID=A0A267FL36_9PLAT|nr:hypothetical protein BOX15_Mlig002988g2 [Macrostomum lignano]